MKIFDNKTMASLWSSVKLYKYVTYVYITCILVIYQGVTEPISGCPAQCTCFSAHHDTVVNCTARDLNILPQSLPTDTAQLYLDQNLIDLTKQVFPYLPRLKKLVLSNCDLVDFPVDLFTGKVPRLEIIDLSYNSFPDVPFGLPGSVKTVVLSYNEIKTINSSALSGIVNAQELFLDNNLIRSISNSSFSFNQPFLPKLTKVTLHQNKISYIHSRAFNNLSALTALSLAGNRLTHINSSSFEGLWNLQHLDISANRIHSVEENTFFTLQELKMLQLNRNHLKNIPKGLPPMEWLDLSHNQLVVIPEFYQADLYPIEVFNIAHNPLKCDCDMLWLKELYDRREYVVKHLNMEPSEFVPTCESPDNLHGESWDTLGDDMFTCEGGHSSLFMEDETVIVSDVELEPRSDQLQVKSGKVTHNTIQLQWSTKGPISFKTVYIQYYVFGLRDTTTKHVEVATVQKHYTLKHTHHEANYIVCVIPRLKETTHTSPPLSLEHCLEIRTPEKPPVEILSYLTVFSYYFLGMMSTIIAIFAGIGLIGLLCGVYMKSSDWATRCVPMDGADDTDTPDHQGQQPSGERQGEDVPNKPHID